MGQFKEKLRQLEAQGRLRSVTSAAAGVDLTSNDYLGFADHSALRDAAVSFFENGGPVGAGASRLLRGAMEEHHALEEYAAAYFCSEAALFFSSGFQANMAVFTSLAQRGDVIIFDALIHASSRDGIQSSNAKHMRAAHNDLDAYEEALKKARGECNGQIWVAVESVYSMDGDQAPLEALYALCERYEAVLIIDEAHGVGVCGETGKGVSEALITEKGYEQIITVYTCGKALGVAGGLVCGTRDVIDYMVNTARGFIYSTAPMPVQAHLVQKSLELLASAEGQTARENLREVCDYTHALLGGPGGHIIPIVIGEDSRAVEVAKAMQQAGYDVRAIRPPTVPEGTARLRVSLNASLEKDVLQNFADALGSARKEKAA